MKSKTLLCLTVFCAAVLFAFGAASFAQSNIILNDDGDGYVMISGELRQWHKVTLDLAGPFCNENDTTPNPFTDYCFTVTFEHESGTPKYTVPGYFSADGNAAESGVEAGNVWRAHLSPDQAGQWSYRISFVRGPGVAVSDLPGESVAPYHGQTGSFQVKPTDKSGRDFRGKGRLQ